MTREEAISIMKVIVHMLEEKYDTDRVEDAVDMAIKALEQEPCEDCISRKAVLDLVEDMTDQFGVEHRVITEGVISMLPPVTPKPMQVELEGDGYADGELVYDYGKCPKCGWEFEYGDKDWEEPYCCNCGQKLHWFESEGQE